MTDPDIPTTGTDSQTRKPAVNLLAWLGPIVTLVGAISYFLFFVQFAALRDFPWLNLPLVALGGIISFFGLWRVFSNAEYKFISKGFATLGFLFSLALGALFYFYIFDISYRMPSVEGVSQVAEVAPDFSLLDQNNKVVQLSDFRGKKLVVAFYRGHW